MRVYVPTRLLPQVRQGQRAVARLDGYPDRPIEGRVVAISPEAEFTPRIALTDTTGLLRPGLPATVEFEGIVAR